MQFNLFPVMSLWGQINNGPLWPILDDHVVRGILVMICMIDCIPCSMTSSITIGSFWVGWWATELDTCYYEATFLGGKSSWFGCLLNWKFGIIKGFSYCVKSQVFLFFSGCGCTFLAYGSYPFMDCTCCIRWTLHYVLLKSLEIEYALNGTNCIYWLLD